MLKHLRREAAIQADLEAAGHRIAGKRPGLFDRDDD
jgi:hypothetical protein